ncbi:MAG TPA: tautomerase family protein [Rhodopila sp.]|uniref:tautomerase family protein n=1 Tax=Rhodopila sp. TaxID=2480087 RepID=UPI002BC79805|nr:tautomerase family protein [Rhodopila sp.]HVY16969.1 tautomerase family protein [Rhodopila sp.]
MPIMDVRYAAGSLDEGAKAALAERLTDVLIRMEGGADTPDGRAFAWVYFTAFRPEDLWVAGAPAAAARTFLVHVSIPEGYMNRTHKDEVHAWVAGAIEATTGRADSAVLTVIDEVTEGNWGSRGRPISLETIAAAVGQPADGPRLAWSRSYFAAKARAMAEAGYPADAGGLPFPAA